jgi:hypothetical protein
MLWTFQPFNRELTFQGDEINHIHSPLPIYDLAGGVANLVSTV